MTTLANLAVVFTGDAKNLLGTVNSVEKSINGLGNTAPTLAGVGLGLAKIGAAAVVGGIGATAVGLSMIARESMSVESAFAGIIKTTDGLGDSTQSLTKDGQALFQEFRNLAIEIPATNEELMKIGELGGQLGVAKEDLVDFTKVIGALGQSTNISTEEGALAFAQMANVIQREGESQMEIIKQMGDSVVFLGNNFATTERDIVNFSQRIMGAGKIAGLTTADVMGISTAFSSVGIEAEAGGTAVQKVLMGINESVITGSEKLTIFAETAGMSADDFKAAWESNPAKAFAAFTEGLGAAGDDALGILSELGLEDQRLIRAFLSAANAGDLMTRAIDGSNQAALEGGALQEEAAKRYATTENQIKLLKNTFREMALTVGDELMPVFNTLLREHILPFTKELATNLGPWLKGTFIPMLKEWGNVFMTVIVPAISTVVGKIQELAGPIIAFVSEHAEAFKGALLAIGAVLLGAMVFGAITSVIALIASLANPVTLVIVLAGLLGAAWAENWGGIREKTQAVIDWIMPYIQTFLATVKAWWDAHGAEVIATVTTLWNTAVALFTWAFTTIQTIVTTVLEGLRAFWNQHGDNIIKIVTFLWNTAVSIFNRNLETLRQIITTVLEGIRAFWEAHGATIIAIVTAFMENVRTVIDTVINVIAGIVDLFHLAQAGEWEAFGAKLREIWDTTWEAVKEIFNRNLEVLKGIAKRMIDGIVEMLKSIDLRDVANGILDGFVEGIKDGAARAIEEARRMAEAVAKIVKGFFRSKSPSKLFEDIGESLPQGLAKGISKIKPVLRAAAGMNQSILAASMRGTGTGGAAAGAAAGNTTVNFNASYAYQSERTLADDIRYYQMVWGVP